MKKLEEILIVDDDDISNIIAVELMNSLKITKKFKIFKNGREAYDYIAGRYTEENHEKQVPELIFLDLHMPVMDGPELIEALKKNKIPELSHVKIVVISASTNDKAKDRFREMGFDEFINKPLTEDKILNIMSKYFPS